MIDLSLPSRPAESIPDTPDTLERVLLQARALIESTVTARRSAPGSRALFEIRPEGQAVVDTTTRLIGRARHSVSIALPGGCELQVRAVGAAISALGAAGRRGVTVRLLCSPRMIGSALVRDASAAGCEVRVVTGELQESVIADGRVAMVRSGPERTGRSAAILENPAAVRALDLLFASTWAGAVPLAAGAVLNERLRLETVRKVLQWLCSGQTDEVAARELSVSLRTYRRHVAEIMRALGATSRFQAGVRAVELGLVERG
ncbi:LuxR C-terminal-related transcriptional regulator [Streptomyces sp. LX-29]|uniref:LuxR C-terminal-related transcriptional regulator n=1 Tax=Streptomyces sp. LX-29 TaxID=2900152 RepID=UPI00240DE068|nr:LuxR C-terminal-related transcriptional regulator [Streptomyces sp. LX-29]WFB08801.1 LuxR C-terminal-related transcriptional regulator [Streptomyces sp. LX-29]